MHCVWQKEARRAGLETPAPYHTVAVDQLSCKLMRSQKGKREDESNNSTPRLKDEGGRRGGEGKTVKKKTLTTNAHGAKRPEEATPRGTATELVRRRRARTYAKAPPPRRSAAGGCRCRDAPGEPPPPVVRLKEGAGKEEEKGGGLYYLPRLRTRNARREAPGRAATPQQRLSGSGEREDLPRQAALAFGLRA